MEQKILTVDQVAHYLQLSQRSVYDLARHGRIPAFKLAKQWRFDRELLDAFIRQQSVVEATEAGAGAQAAGQQPGAATAAGGQATPGHRQRSP